MKKTIWKVMLTLLVCMAAVGGNWSGYKVQAEEYTDGTTGLKYEIVDDTEIKITGYTGEPTTVQIPAKIDEREVTSIAGGLYFGAFSGCKSLTSVIIPDSVTEIGNHAFRGCTSLMEITIPKSVKSIGDCAFYDCTSLTEIIIPEGVTSIGDYAFRGCTSLTEITIPKSVTSIGGVAFWGTEWLEKERLEKESEGKLYVTVNDILIVGLVGDDDDSEDDDDSVIIPKEVTSIAPDAFRSCVNLKSISFESDSKLTSIGDSAFRNCGLTEITIPKSVTSIGSCAFSYCSELTSVTFEPDSSLMSLGDNAFFNCEILKKIEIPAGVKIIGSEAFCDSGLMEITIPGSETRIGIEAFQHCSPTIKTTAGSEACQYAWVHNLKVVDMDGNPLTPPSESEETVPPTPSTPNPTPATPGGTPDTTPVTTPTTETPVQSNVPAAKGKSLTAEKEKARVKVTSDNTANPTVEYAASTNKSAKTVKVPDTVTVDGVTYKVTSVKDKAFKGNKKVTSVTIGKNVTSIGKDAFKNCTSLKSVTIQSSGLTKIESGAFSGNKKLTKITIKTTKLNKNSIGKNALKGTNKKLVIKVPKQQIKNYKKYFKGKGNASVKVTK